MNEMLALTSMKVDAHCQRGSRHWHKGVRFIEWVQRNSTDALVHRVQQERTHTYLANTARQDLRHWGHNVKLTQASQKELRG